MLIRSIFPSDMIRISGGSTCEVLLVTNRVGLNNALSLNFLSNVSILCDFYLLLHTVPYTERSRTIKLGSIPVKVHRNIFEMKSIFYTFVVCFLSAISALQMKDIREFKRIAVSSISLGKSLYS